VLKYAEATRVEVVIRVEHERLEVRVTDNGTGFDPRAVEGTGLTNLADRAAALGGRVRVESRKGVGTTVAVDLPSTLGASR
jgi:signal transduction histidine kinase